jgi:hypothetical protein
MTDKVIQKALQIRQRGGITRDQHGIYRVPSATSDSVYTINGHFCSCPATKLCAHLLAVTYLDALLAIQLIRYADSDEWLQAVVDEYSDRVEVMPLKIRGIVKAEWLVAKERLKPADQLAA